MSKNRPYLFHEQTQSLCHLCYEDSKIIKVVSAKIIIEEGQVLLLKNCPIHGYSRALLEEDSKYFLDEHLYNKPSTICETQTESKLGCPFDCGLCTDHEQHTCIALIELTQSCNLQCPVCYAFSGPHAGKDSKSQFLELETVSKMLDFYQSTEGGEAELLQLSGGEPTIHPQILDVLRLAKEKGINYVMINTNGLRIASDEEFVKSLAEFKPGFEIYLQFDTLNPETSKKIRGVDLTAIKAKALENLAKYDIPVTLVTTVVPEVNENEIGAILNFGMNTKNVRGVNLQPMAFFGRVPENQSAEKRITLTGVLAKIEKQTSGMIKVSDFVPLPCDVSRVSFTYLVRNGGGFIPFVRNVEAKNLLPHIKNTFVFYPEEIVKSMALNPFASCCNIMDMVKDFGKLFPKSFYIKSKKDRSQYISENTFRISVASFIDVYNFDMRSVKKDCVHMITPDLKKIPFSTFNMIYREKYYNHDAR